LRQSQLETMRGILTGELDPGSGLTDLLYVFETLIEMGLAQEAR